MSQPEISSSTVPISSFDIILQSQQQTTNSQPLQPVNNNNNSRRSSAFVRRLIVAILLLFVAASVANFIAWRILHPLPPVFQANKFHISISPPNSTLNKDSYCIVFHITNPNKNLSLFLDRFKLILALQGKTKIATRESTTLPADVCVYVEKNSTKDFPVPGRILKLKSFLQRQKEVLNLNVQVSFRIRFLAWSRLSKSEFMGFECKNLSIRFLSAKGEGDLIFGERGQCSVEKNYA